MHGPRFDRLVPPGGYLWWYLDATQVGEVPVRAVHESLSLSRFSSKLVQTMLPFRIRRVG